jgi:hypothetical protein
VTRPLPVAPSWLLARPTLATLAKLAVIQGPAPSPLPKIAVAVQNGEVVTT